MEVKRNIQTNLQTDRDKDEERKRDRDREEEGKKGTDNKKYRKKIGRFLLKKLRYSAYGEMERNMKNR